ncbi:unnamed protein product [Caretta caretta]
MKAFYKGTKSSGTDGNLLITDKGDILSCWAVHFDSVLNCQSTMSDEAINSLRQCPVLEELSMNPSLDNGTKAIKQLSMGKSPDPDGFLPEVYKCGGAHLVRRLKNIFKTIWKHGTVSQEHKDVS